MTTQYDSAGLQRIRQTREDLRSEGRGIADRAKAEQRDLRAGEQTRIEQIVAEMRALDQAEADAEAGERHAAQLQRSFDDLAARPVDQPAAANGHARGSLGYSQDQALREMICEGSRKPLLVNHEKRGFWQPAVEMRNGTEARTGLVKGTAASGGYTVATNSIYNRVFEVLTETTPIFRAGATVISTDDGVTLSIPRVTSLPQFTLTNEAAALTPGDPVFATTSLGSYKLAIIVAISSELAADNSIDLINYLGGLLGRGLANAWSPYFTTGTGSSQPRGYTLDSTLGVTGATGLTGGFGTQATAGQGTDYVNSLLGSLADPYISTGSPAFLARNSTITAIRNLKASTGELVGNAYVQNSPIPWHIDPNVAATGLSAKSLFAGDFSKYVVRLAGPMRLERSDDVYFDSDQVALRLIQRFDGALCDLSGAIKHFVGGAS